MTSSSGGSLHHADVGGGTTSGDDAVPVIGYSERGVLNSLLYEISNSRESTRLFRALLSRVTFPARSEQSRFQSAFVKNVLVEQSLSDFGDADCVLLLENAGRKQTVFVEAKVSTLRPPAHYVDSEFRRFTSKMKTKLGSSILFTQLYYKMRLADALKVPNGMQAIQAGVEFPRCLGKRGTRRRKIGKNHVVLRAAQLIKNHLDDAFFVAIVPFGKRDDDKTISDFFANEFVKYPCPLEGWADGLRNWGYLAWNQVKSFCEEEKLDMTCNVLRFNDGQISSDLNTGDAEE